MHDAEENPGEQASAMGWLAREKLHRSSPETMILWGIEEMQRLMYCFIVVVDELQVRSLAVCLKK